MTIPELTKYCMDNQDVIFVRAKKNGKWGTYALAELDPDVVEDLIKNWHLENRMPVRILES